MKKIFSGSLLALLMVLIMSACGSSDELSIMGKESDMSKSYMTSIIDQYEKATGDKVKVISIDDEKFEEEAEKSFASGDAPDILMHFNNAELARFDPQENFRALNDEGWAVDLTESARAYCSDDEGRLLGLPFWENSVSGCYYNKRIFDKLGLKAASTQKEFDDLCRILAEKGYTPVCWPGDNCSWMPQFGLDPVFSDNRVLLTQLNEGKKNYADIPAVTDMLKWLDEAASAGWFGGDFMQTGWDDIDDALAGGDAVMTFIWDTWFYTDFKADGEYSRDDFALMPVFMGTADRGTYESGNLNMMMVNKNSRNKDRALEFLEFCASEENYNKAFDGIATISCFINQTTNIESPMVTDAYESIVENERMPVAVSDIAGYSAEDTMAAIDSLLEDKTDIDDCIDMMDESRLKGAKKNQN